MSTKVLSVGGSIVAPEYPDVEFVKQFVEMVKNYLAAHKGDRLILVVGGGGPARIYQKAFRDVTGTAPDGDVNAADWIGIMATRLNAQFVKACFGDLCKRIYGQHIGRRRLETRLFYRQRCRLAGGKIRCRHSGKLKQH